MIRNMASVLSPGSIGWVWLLIETGMITNMALVYWLGMVINRNWNDYNNGFGQVTGEYWLGMVICLFFVIWLWLFCLHFPDFLFISINGTH